MKSNHWALPGNELLIIFTLELMRSKWFTTMIALCRFAVKVNGRAARRLLKQLIIAQKVMSSTTNFWRHYLALNEITNHTASKWHWFPRRRTNEIPYHSSQIRVSMISIIELVHAARMIYLMIPAKQRRVPHSARPMIIPVISFGTYWDSQWFGAGVQWYG